MTQVTATDADDPTYGNSARVVYSILHGQPYFSVDPKTGESNGRQTSGEGVKSTRGLVLVGVGFFVERVLINMCV